ncbi:MAG: SpoIIE family protein phosphatase [Flavobacteriales bacterium]|nr:SpoIIE family protein phosphatase [Flavobacteriales bacterium]
MGRILKYRLDEVFKNFTAKIMLTVFFFLVLVTLIFLYLSYRSHVASAVEREFIRLQCATRPLASRIDAKQHEQIRSAYNDPIALDDDIEISGYLHLHEQLKETKFVLGLDSDIYTLVKDPASGEMVFIVTSADQAYFKHVWERPHQETIDKYDLGAQFGPYTDENGTWLSVFEPIKLNGRTIAIVQADKRFDVFMSEARMSFLNTLLTFLVVFVIAIGVLIRWLNKLLSDEERIRNKLLNSSELIAAKNKHITDSIRVAERIQLAVLPSIERIRKELPTFDVFYQPKDLVSGDFYWYEKVGAKVYVAVGDCTGHGVPGAMMSMMASSALYHVLKHNGESVAEMLHELDDITRKNWHKDEERSAGMDLALCCYDQETMLFTFASAVRPLVIMRDGELIKIKGDRSGIGAYGSVPEFKEQTIQVLPGDTLYLFSDGFVDQFGGGASKRYKTGRFNNFLSLIQEHPMEEQIMLMRYEFHLWKQTEEQVDDVLVVGFRIPGQVLQKTA